MKLDFTPEQEAHLAELAVKTGTEPECLVKDAALRLLEDDRFREAVIQGEAALERGEFLTHEQVGERLQRFLQQHP